ncbi:tetratricopeptide repeat protein [Myroides odoratus]
MKKPFFFLLLFFLIHSALFSQSDKQVVEKKIDSLTNILAKNTATDTLTVGQMNTLARLLIEEKQFDRAFSYTQKALKLSEKLDFKKGKANTYHVLGKFYDKQEKDLEAVKNYTVGLKLFEEIGDERQVAFSYYYIGTLYSYQGDFPEALQNLYAGLKLFEKIGHKKGIGLCYSGIGIIYGNTDKHEEALKNHSIALKVWKETGDILGLSECYNNMGLIYEFQGKYPEALENYFAALEIKKELGNKRGIAGVYNNIGAVYQRQGKNKEALENFLNSLQGFEEINEKGGIAMTYLNIGIVESTLDRPAAAKEHYKKALAIAKEMGRKEIIMNIYYNATLDDSTLGDYKDAYENYKQYIVYRDSLMNEDTERKSLEVAMEYEYDKKEAVIQEELKTKKLQRNFAFAGLVVMVLFALLGVYFYRLRNKKLKVEKQNLELQRREVETIKQTEQFKSRFLANISHEFRTPLTLINGHIEVLKENGRKEDFSHFDEIEQNGKRLLTLINQLLDLSKMESGEYKLHYKKGDVLNEASMLVQSFHSYAEQHNILLQINQAEGVRESLTAHPFIYSSEALTVIITNLLSNAIKYTPSGGSVTVEIAYKDNKLLIRVIDTGKGIDAEDLPKIFDRFYQVDDPGKRAYAGFGIGLALVKELVILHGGDIKVDSPSDGGCIFTFWIESGLTENNKDLAFTGQNLAFPVKEENQLERQEHQNTELPLLLIVEDQPELRHFIVQNLGKEYRYVEASNGNEGVKLAEELLPDLIISDVMMPDTNGFQLCEILKNNVATSHIPIILLTAKAEQKDMLFGLETGADDYLAKPFSLAELKLRVRNILKFKALLREKFSGNSIPSEEIVPELNKKDRKFIDDLELTVQQNFSNVQFGVNILAEAVFLSVSQLSRKLKTITGKTPADFIRGLRFEKAIQLLREGASVAETSWAVGFDDPVYFSKVFKKHFGFPPSSVKK